MSVDRRSFLVLTGSAAGSVAVPLPGLAGAADLGAGDLRTEFVERPIGIEFPEPRLSWKLRSARRGVVQAAYRVRVASSAESLAAGTADLWDSGRIASAQQVEIVYRGSPLRSRQRCFWQVEVWDNSGASAKSPVEWWEMGLLAADDWQAQWIIAEDAISAADRQAGLHWIWGAEDSESARRFRFHFSLPAAPTTAVLLIAAKEKLHQVVANGVPVADLDRTISWGVMRPVAIAGLKRGRNLLALSATAGKNPFFAGGGLVAVLRVDLDDGSTLRLVSGPEWRTALTDAPDWAAPDFDDRKWASASPSKLPPIAEIWPAGPAMLLRHDFMARGRVVRARLYATALGAYEARLNGERVGDRHLAPESTDFRKRLLYQIYDVTKLMQEGANTLGATVADGWYASAFTFLPTRYAFGPPPRRFLAQLEITYEDGTTQTIATGPGWRTDVAPVLASELYDGEAHDARREQTGWDRPGFDAARWAMATAGAVPPAPLEAQYGPAIRVTQVLKPQKADVRRPGVTILDFGQNFSGWCRLKVRGPAGTRIQLRHSEILDAAGELSVENLRSARATDVYILKGDPAGEVWEPRFTYHGFRYVEVTGYPGPLPADAIEAVVVHTDCPISGNFEIDKPVVQQVWRNALWSQRGNFVAVPTDCPQRDERMGWMGDAQVFWDAAAFNMDVDAFTRRFMGDVRVAQSADGAFPDVTPNVFEFGGSPGWADGGVILPWTAFWRYGDLRIIDQNWDAMVRWTRYVQDANPDLIWRNKRGADYGDWLAVDAKFPGDPTTPKDLIGTAFFAHSTDLIRRMAEASGRSAEAGRYRQLHHDIVQAFNAEFVRSDGTVGNGSQTGYIQALRFGLLPPGLRQAAGEHLAADIRRRGTKLSTGFLGTPYILDALVDSGQAELAYTLLLQTDYPSWGYMVAKGATSMWERWNGDTGDVSMNSYNHYAFGAVVGFFYRRIAGIDALVPGFERIRIAPVLDARVSHAGADYESVRGRIACHWQRNAASLTVEVTVPPNATSEIHLPAASSSQVTEGGRAVTGRRDLRIMRTTRPGTIELEAGSGDWRFTVT